MHRLIISPVMPFDLACGLEVTTIPAIGFHLFAHAVHVRVEWTYDRNSDDVRNIVDREVGPRRDFSQLSASQFLSAKAIQKYLFGNLLRCFQVPMRKIGWLAVFARINIVDGTAKRSDFLIFANAGQDSGLQ